MVRTGVATLIFASVALTSCATDTGTGPESTAVDVAAPTSTEPPVTPTTTTAPPSEPGPSIASALPDVSARTLTSDDLLRMLDGATVLTNEALAARSVLDPDDEAADHLTYRRLTGVEAGVGSDTRARIDLLDDPTAAAAFLVDRVGDMAKGIEGNTPAVSVDEFPVDPVGDQTVGVIVVPSDGSLPTTTVFARLGRIVATVELDRSGDARVAAQYVAEDVASAIAGVLLSAPSNVIPSETPPYSFSAEHIAETADAQTTWRATGSVVGANRSCSIDGDDIASDLRLVDDVVWSRPPGAVEFRRVGGPATIERSVLSRCPSWSLDASTSGLDKIIGPDPAAYRLGGIDVLGHRGDADDLAAILGVDRAGIDVKVFNLWIANGTSWVVELDLVASGPGSVMQGLLAMAVPDDERVTVTIRHRVTDLGSAPEIVAPE